MSNPITIRHGRVVVLLVVIVCLSNVVAKRKIVDAKIYTPIFGKKDAAYFNEPYTRWDGGRTDKSQETESLERIFARMAMMLKQERKMAAEQEEAKPYIEYDQTRTSTTSKRDLGEEQKRHVYELLRTLLTQ
ncbi:uncharacterized protein [Ptychodera flava]|uniref:uncharacterized protein n=1 Tax=Ptychodera flava TaxID=63121 RepID=UPI003969C59E